MSEKKGMVANELIETEERYVEDLEICVKTFLDSDRVASGVDIKVLFGNIRQVVEVGRELTARLIKTTAVEESERCYGTCFLDMANLLKSAYTPFCRNHDDKLGLLDAYIKNVEISEWLEWGISEMKKETNVFDMSSILIKPVQRILKYPLLLRELEKNTPENHPDKVTLAQAIVVMNGVAKEINEIKRRKDVVTKYKEESSFGDKISKLNIHSVKKKSSRVSQRISQGLLLSTTELKIPSRTIVLQGWVSCVGCRVSPNLNMVLFPNALS